MRRWLPEALNYIPEWLAFQMRFSGQPGISVAVADGDTLVFEQAFGVANAQTAEALTPRHRFRVASHSKTFTTTAILKLVEAGRLRLGDRVGAYVEGLHDAVGNATIMQALSHTAGIIRDGTDATQWQGHRPFLNEAELRAALAEAPILDANTRFKYSNHGYGLLGLVIEFVTGEPYNSWIAREIVAAAGLSETTPDTPLAEGTRLSQGHGANLLLGKPFVIPADTCTHALASATGFVSTASDLARFFAQLSPAAKTSILSVASRREMIRPQWSVPDSSVPRSYGLGTISGRIGDWSWFGHTGGFPGVRSQTAVFADQDLTISVLANSINSVRPPAMLVEGISRILQAFARYGAPEPRLADWKGRWWSFSEATDLVAMGSKVIAAAPVQVNPFEDVSELTVTAPDQALISRAGGFLSHGETARLDRDPQWNVEAVWIGGSKLLPETIVAEEALKRYGAD